MNPSWDKKVFATDGAEEIRTTKPEIRINAFRHSGFGFDSSF